MPVTHGNCPFSLHHSRNDAFAIAIFSLRSSLSACCMADQIDSLARSQNILPRQPDIAARWFSSGISSTNCSVVIGNTSSGYGFVGHHSGLVVLMLHRIRNRYFRFVNYSPVTTTSYQSRLYAQRPQVRRVAFGLSLKSEIMRCDNCPTHSRSGGSLLVLPSSLPM